MVSDTNSGFSFFDGGIVIGVFRILLLGLGVFFFWAHEENKIINNKYLMYTTENNKHKF
jgi:hypothetical protein